MKHHHRSAGEDQSSERRNAELKARLQHVLGELDGILDQIETAPEGLNPLVHHDVKGAWEAVDELLLNFEGWTSSIPPTKAAA